MAKDILSMEALEERAADWDKALPIKQPRPGLTVGQLAELLSKYPEDYLVNVQAPGSDWVYDGEDEVRSNTCEWSNAAGITEACGEVYIWAEGDEV